MNVNSAPLRNQEHAFPPMMPGIPLKSVYERAGFDINRGGPRKGSKDPISIPPRSRQREMSTTSSGSDRSKNSKSSANHSASSSMASSRSSLRSASSIGGMPYSTNNSSCASFTTVPSTATTPSLAPSPTKLLHLSSGSAGSDSALSAKRQVSLPKISVISKPPLPTIHSATGPGQMSQAMNNALPTPPLSAPPGGPEGNYFPAEFRDAPPPTFDGAGRQFGTPELSQSPQPLQWQKYPTPKLQYSPIIESPKSPASPSLDGDHMINDDPYATPYATDLPTRSNSVASSIYSSAIDPVMDISPLPSARNSTRSYRSDVLPRKQLRYNGGAGGKKVCRGCGEGIQGKSVSSKDGRVSGKWHRKCFNCTGCQASFDSGEFYVLDDHPYCQHCYHYENHSLCHTCDLPIEGECLESDDPSGVPLRYHLGCLRCHDCEVVLNDDYYLYQDRPLCHDHASRLGGSEQSKVEKRRTRVLLLDPDNIL